MPVFSSLSDRRQARAQQTGRVCPVNELSHCQRVMRFPIDERKLRARSMAVGSATYIDEGLSLCAAEPTAPDAYRSSGSYDAIVILGVVEYLPDYQAVLGSSGNY